MRTALQQAFARLEELHPSLFDIHTEKGRTFVNEFSKFLEVEREQIMDAYEVAEKDCGKDFLHGDLYYHETFKSE
jgi:ferredoxin